MPHPRIQPHLPPGPGPLPAPAVVLELELLGSGTEARESLLARVLERQQKVGYTDYESWVEASKPPEFV